MPEKTIYLPKKSTATVSLNPIISTKEPEWFLPNPAHSAAQFAALGLWEACVEGKASFDDLGHRWLCFLMLPGMLVRRKASPGKPVFVLGCVDIAATLAWAAEQKTIGRSTFWRPLCEPVADSPWTWCVCIDIDAWEVEPLSFHPLSRYLQDPRGATISSTSGDPTPDPGGMLWWAEAHGSWISLLAASAREGLDIHEGASFFELMRRWLSFCDPGMTQDMELGILYRMATKSATFVGSEFWSPQVVAECFDEPSRSWGSKWRTVGCANG